MAVRLKSAVISAPLAAPVPSIKIGGVVTTIYEVMATEYIQIYNELTVLGVDEKFARMEELRKGMLAGTEGMDPTEPAVITCAEGDVEFSKVPDTRCVVDAYAVIQLVEEAHGKEAAQSIAKVTIGDLEKVLSANEIAPLVTTKTGTRRLSSVRPKAKEEVV